MKKKILIVSGRPALTMALGSRLTKKGFSVKIFGNLDDGLSYFQHDEHRQGVIVVDMNDFQTLPLTEEKRISHLDMGHIKDKFSKFADKIVFIGTVDPTKIQSPEIVYIKIIGPGFENFESVL